MGGRIPRDVYIIYTSLGNVHCARRARRVTGSVGIRTSCLGALLLSMLTRRASLERAGGRGGEAVTVLVHTSCLRAWSRPSWICSSPMIRSPPSPCDQPSASVLRLGQSCDANRNSERLEIGLMMRIVPLNS
jgi:hypothetical protein